MLAKIINEQTKQVEIGYEKYADFYKSIGMTEMEVEQSYDGSWYVKGYAPEKPESVINKEKVDEARQYLESTDYIWNVIREGDATEEHYADVIAKRKEARELIRSLENG